MSSDKMRWDKPQLIVLARGMPEESVLFHCKTQNPKVRTRGPFVDYLHADCAAGRGYENCSNCHSRAMGS